MDKPTTENKNPEGRPTDYKDEFVQLIKNYYLECKTKNQMPYVEDVALICDVDIRTIERWIEHEIDDEFCRTVKKVKTLQRKMLANSGLGGGVNVAMAIFLLKANHGLVEVSRNELTGKDGAPLEDGKDMIELLTNLLNKNVTGKPDKGITAEQSEIISEGEKKPQTNS